MGEPINDTISPWMPEQDQIKLAVLGKLAEEAAELASRAARCIIQGGLDEIDPDTGRTNAEELAREIADVEACTSVACQVLDTDVTPDSQRMMDKRRGFTRWHDMIRERQP